jgi:hypothetical protein
VRKCTVVSCLKDHSYDSWNIFVVISLPSKARKERLFPFPTEIVGRRSHLFAVNDLDRCHQVLHRCRSYKIKASGIVLNVALLTGMTAIRNVHSYSSCTLRPKCEIHGMRDGKISGRRRFQYGKETLQNFVRSKLTKFFLMELSLLDTTS